MSRFLGVTNEDESLLGGSGDVIGVSFQAGLGAGLRDRREIQQSISRKTNPTGSTRSTTGGSDLPPKGERRLQKR